LKRFFKGVKAIKATVSSFAEETGALILDTRNNGDFAKGFIPQSILAYRWRFCSWVGALIAMSNNLFY
jgi:hypothetical protein